MVVPHASILGFLLAAFRHFQIAILDLLHLYCNHYVHNTKTQPCFAGLILFSVDCCMVVFHNFSHSLLLKYF
jgi:hypothetical protein